jgi:hypothetical protein
MKDNADRRREVSGERADELNERTNAASRGSDDYDALR